MKKVLLFIISSLYFSFAVAQSDRQYVRQGNKQFRGADFANAEVSYRKALEKNDRNPQAHYNLGNSLLSQNKDSAAVAEYEKATKTETNPLRKAQAYHNMGVICQRHQMFGEAIEAYKNSLRLNPHDDETRYNLELCKRQQKKQQNQQNKDNKNNQDKKDNNKQDQQKQQQQQKQKQQQKQEPKMSKENAEQLLNAAMQQEKQTQERMKKAQQQPQRRNVQKNW